MYCAGPASGTRKMLGHKHFLMLYLQQSPLLGIVTSRLLYPHKMKGNVYHCFPSSIDALLFACIISRFNHREMIKF